MEAIALMAFILNSVGKVICVPVRTGSGDAAVNLERRVGREHPK